MTGVPPVRSATAGNLCRQRYPDIFFAAHLLPRDKRQAVFTLAAVVDQVHQIIVPDTPSDEASPAGGCGCDSTDERRRVARAVIDHLYAGEPTGKAELDGFAAITRTHHIPSEPLHTAVDALLEHTVRKRYATWASLFDHCRRFAGAFAALTLPILAPDADNTARTQAHSLAAAMYATHLLLRTGIDGRAGRVSMPLDDLVRFKLTDRQWCAFAHNQSSDNDPRVRDLLAFHAERLTNLYTGGLKAVRASSDPAVRRACTTLTSLHVRRIDQALTGRINIFAHPPRPNLWERLRALTG